MNRDRHIRKCFAALVLFYCLLLQEIFADSAQGLHLQKQREVRLCQGRLTAIVCSLKGNLIAGSAADGVIYLWDREGRVLRHFDGGGSPGKSGLSPSGYDKPSTVVALAFSPDEKHLIIAPERGFLQIVNLGEGESPRSLKWLESPCSLAVSPDGTRLAVGTRSGDILLWDMASRRLLHILDGHTYFVTSLAFTARGDLLASGSWDRTIRLWNVLTGKTEKVIREPEEHPPLLFSTFRGPSQSADPKESRNQPVVSLAFSGNELARGGLDGSVVIWDVDSGGIVKKIKGDGSEASCIAFAPDSPILARGSGSGTVGMWSLAPEGEPMIQKGHEGTVKFVRFMDDYLISGSLDGSLCFWSCSTR
jgi:WD40 repeat protein